MGNNATKKPFYLTTLFRIASAIIACAAIITVTVFFLTKKPADNLPLKNNNSQNNQNVGVGSNNGPDNSQNKTYSDNSSTNNSKDKIIHVTADSPDDYILINDENGLVKQKNFKYLSEPLLEKMDLYKDYKDDEVVYHLTVQIFFLSEDRPGFEEIENNNQELITLKNQYEAACDEVKKIEENFLANTPKDPTEQEKVRKEILDLRNAAEALKNQYDQKSLNLFYQYEDSVINKRLEYAAQFCQNEPVLDAVTSDLVNRSRAYFMNLTASEINILASLGGYMFALAPN